MTVRPYALGDNHGEGWEPIVSRHQFDDIDQTCLAARSLAVDTTEARFGGPVS